MSHVRIRAHVDFTPPRAKDSVRSYIWGRIAEEAHVEPPPEEAKKLKPVYRHSAKAVPGLAQAIALAIALAICLALLGCGNAPIIAAVRGPAILTDCEGVDGAKVAALDLVLLDWTGGVSEIYPNMDLPAFDLSLFETPEGTLLDVEDAFKEAVRNHVAALMCDFSGQAVAIRTGEGPSVAPTSTVYSGKVELGTGKPAP